MTDMTNICRYDNDKGYQHYWLVKFEAFGIQKIFSDGKFNGKSGALLAAIMYRDLVRSKYPPNYLGTPNDKGHYESAKGVYFKESKKTLDARWVAFWDEKRDGKRNQKQKSFNVHKHGSVEAKRLAVEYRAKKLKDLHG